MSKYRCFLFTGSTLVQAGEFTSEAAARLSGSASLIWEECDRVEIWKDHEKIVEWEEVAASSAAPVDISDHL